MWYANVQRNTRLGALLVKRGLIDSEQLRRAIVLQRSEPTCNLGDILVREGYLGSAQLRACLRRQARIRWCAAIAAMFCAPLQLMAGGLPTASANAERVAYEAARDYADRPQLKLHDGGAFASEEKVKQASVYKAARILTYMMLDSVWASMRNADEPGRADAQTQRSPRFTTRYTLRLSEEKILLRVNYRF